MGRAGRKDEAKNRGRPEVLGRSGWSAGVASVVGCWFEVKSQIDVGDICELLKVRQNLVGALFGRDRMGREVAREFWGALLALRAP
jgi:hypothetical protein